MNNIEKSMSRMLNVTLYLNFVFIILFIVKFEFSVLSIAISNIIIIGSYIILNKNKFMINGILATRQVGKTFDNLLGGKE